jgi:hypothetical protein
LARFPLRSFSQIAFCMYSRNQLFSRTHFWPTPVVSPPSKSPQNLENDFVNTPARCLGSKKLPRGETWRLIVKMLLLG